MMKFQDQPLEKQIKNINRPKKADIVFNKLLSKQKKPKNPFDEIRSYTPQSTKEIKPGDQINDTN